MFCEKCGKKLRGGSFFCINCGTPVPEEVLNDKNYDQTLENNIFAADSDSSFNSNNFSDLDDDNLIFCLVCGVRMQKRPDKCEKCGMILIESPGNDSRNAPTLTSDNSGGNTVDKGGKSISAGGSKSDVGIRSSGDMAGIKMDGSGNTPNGLYIRTRFSINTNIEIPTVDTPDKFDETDAVRKKELEKGKERRVEDFSMSGMMESVEPLSLSDKTVPVIKGGSMEDDGSKDIELDPYKFLKNSMGDI